MLVKFEDVADRVIELRGEKVIIDSDVAQLYGVETRDINKSVKNNPDKFPEGYVFELSPKEMEDLRWKFSTAKFAKTRYMPKAFTEKGLYMLATILRSPEATQTTLAIIEAFSKLRQLSRNIRSLATISDKDAQRKVAARTGEILSDIIGNPLDTTGTETSVELNLAFVKLRHTIKRSKKH